MKDNKVFIQHILDEINFISKECKDLKLANLIKNEVLTRAITRSLEIISEATKNLSDDFRKRYSEIDWKALSGLSSLSNSFNRPEGWSYRSFSGFKKSKNRF